MINNSHNNQFVRIVLLFIMVLLSNTVFSDYRAVMLENNTRVPGTGWSVSRAGDVNGDGIDDVLIGSNSPVFSGSVSVFYGSSTGTFNPVNGSANIPDWRYSSDRRLGFSVSHAGDINGDGFDDIVVGDYLNGDVVSNGGMVAVFFGSASGLSATPDWQVYGDQTNAYFGFSVSGGMDFNNDGFNDIAIGANRYSDGETEEGKIFVYHGSANGLPDDDVDKIARLDEASWTVQSNINNGRMGWSVAHAGDVNGDGYDDLITGTPWRATATLYYGSTTGLGTTPVWTVTQGSGSFASFAKSVATAGDINNDGYDDIIIGRPNNGQSFVYFGSATVPSTTFDWSTTGSTGTDQSVATAGDLNNDNYSDIIIGYPGYDNEFTNAGAAFVFYGSATGPRSDGGVDIQVEGDALGVNFGHSVAAAGDLDNDGKADFVVGVPGHDHSGGNRGLAFVYLSSPVPAHITIAPHQIHTIHNLNEAGQASTFDIVLDTAPTENVTIGIVSSDTTEGIVSPASLLFTPTDWNTPRTVTMTGVDDFLDDGNVSFFINFTVSSSDPDYDGMMVDPVSVQTLDDDCACVTVTPKLSPPLITRENGDTAIFTMVLDADPEGTLLVNIISQDTTEGTVSTNQLIFDSSNFKTPQSVTVTGVDDEELDGDITYLILNTAVSSGPYRFANISNVFVTNQDDEFTFTEKSIEGSTTYGMLGRAVSGVGDVNGDGVDDFVIGAPGEANGEYKEGRVHLYYGSRTDFTGTPDLILESDSNNPFFGGAVAAAGDVNSDGYDDVLIGAYRFTGSFSDEGKAFLYYGSASGLITTPAWTMVGGQDKAHFGRAVASAGDVNGDGYGDILIGSSNYSLTVARAGQAYLYYGSASGPSLVPDWVGEGQSSLDAYGSAVASAGDVNNDGYDDIIIGASKNDIGGRDSGRAYVYYGSASGPSSVEDWATNGDAANDYYASSVSGAGDVNGDGYADIIIGAELDTSSIFGPRWDSGRLFAFYGSASGLSTTPSWVFDNEQPYAQLGGAVTGLGDINSDGYDDIIAGATHYDHNQTDEGAALIFFGSETGLSTTPITLEKEQDQALFGVSVGAGDIDGDSIPDIIVGSNLYDTATHLNAGAAYFYLSAKPGILVSPTAGLQTSETLTEVSFTVVLTTVPTADVTIPISSDDTTEGTINTALLTFTPSNWYLPQTVTVTGVDDSDVDGDIPYRIILAPASSSYAVYDGWDADDVVMINIDDDAPRVSLSVTDAAAWETGSDEGEFVVSRVGSTATSLTINYALSGTATNGSDYVTLPGSVTIVAGSSSAVIPVTPIDDVTLESTESITLTLTPDISYEIEAPGNGTVTIDDNDSPAIRITPSSGLVTTEAGGTASFDVVLLTAPTSRVWFSLSSNNTAEGKIFINELEFTTSNWNIPQTVTVVGQGDGVVDGDTDYLIVTGLSQSFDSNYFEMVLDDISVTNIDDELMPNVTIAVTEADAREPRMGTEYNGTFIVSRTGSTDSALTVYYTISGTAISGTDYAPISGNVTMSAGSSSATIDITPYPDAVSEGDETVTLTLTANTAYVVDPPNTDTIIIADDDQATLPVANFNIDQTIGESNSFDLWVILDRPTTNWTYIPYTVSGTASNPEDHLISDGTITIPGGFDRNKISFNVVGDMISDDNETIIFTMGAISNATIGENNIHTVTIREINVAPIVTLRARQPVDSTRIIVTSLTNPWIEAIVEDPNISDTFTYDWSLTDGALVDSYGTATDDTFVFLSNSVSPGFYNMHVRVTDSGTPPLSSETELLLEVVDIAPPLLPGDSDGDGVADAAESYNDSDRDGIPDYLDHSDLQEDQLQQLATQSDSYIMRTDPGLKLRLGDVAFAAGSDGAQVSQNDITNYGDNLGGAGLNPEDSVPNVGGYFDFEIYDLSQPGDSANIVIPQLAPIPEGAWYRKYDPLVGWRDFVVDGSNAIASAPGEAGLCPIPNDLSYTPGLTTGHYCMRLTIEDGGPNDNDGVANSVIEDPGVIGVNYKKNNADEAQIERSGGGSAGLMTLFLLLGFLAALKRPPKRRRF